MRRLALLAALALLPASVVSAEPQRREREREQYTYNEGFYDRDGRRVDRYRYRDRDRDRQYGYRRWEPIAEQYSATSERQFINVLGRGGRFTRLLVEGVRGAPVIERVAVEFEDRQTQVWDLNRRLPRGADEIIRLGGAKRIHRIVVYTNPQYRGAYSIYGA